MTLKLGIEVFYRDYPEQLTLISISGKVAFQFNISHILGTRGATIFSNGHLYWTDASERKVWRSNFDGTGMLMVLDTGTSSPSMTLYPCYKF